jgi:hypothetical protein
MRKALIYHNDYLVTSFEFDLFTSELIEKSYFFTKDNKTVAVVPHNYLIIIENEKNI